MARGVDDRGRLMQEPPARHPEDRPAEDAATELDDDLTRLAPDDLRRVCRWAEDRLVNAVTPLAIRLQGDMSGRQCGDHTLMAAQWAVNRVLAAVDEVRRMIREARKTSKGNASVATQATPPVSSEMPLAANIAPPQMPD